MQDLYMFLHIPRTGGTTLIESLGQHDDRKKGCFEHFTYVQNWSEQHYIHRCIPNLRNRTKEQQKQLKLLSGHSIFCNSDKWLKFKTNKKIFTYVRNPIERLLSDFNYRYITTHLLQLPEDFTRVSPWLNSYAINQAKTAKDYDTLYEFLQDFNFGRNTQCKFLIKSFAIYDQDQWHRLPNYMSGPDSGPNRDMLLYDLKLSWPDWMFSDDIDTDLWKLLQNFLDEFWYIGVTENLSNDLEPLAKTIDIDYNYSLENSTHNMLEKPYWTMDDVLNQPDIDLLTKELEYDFKLYEYAKKFARPF